jgi:HSP20 family protein
MTHVKFNNRPFEHSLNNFVDDLFSELPVLFKNDFGVTQSKGFTPVNITETANGYQVEVIAPGFEKTDFKVTLEQNLLTVSGERKDQPLKENEKKVRNEYGYRSFKRSFTIDEKIDATGIQANYVNGVLVLNLPKKEDVKAPAKEIVIN